MGARGLIDGLWLGRSASTGSIGLDVSPGIGHDVGFQVSGSWLRMSGIYFNVLLCSLSFRNPTNATAIVVLAGS